MTESSPGGAQDLFLRLDKISKKYGGVTALEEVSCSVRKGEIHCLAGENGSGKSTLIKIISGIEHPDSGLIYFDSDLTRHLDTTESIRRGVQVIYQDLSLFSNLTVAENIALPSVLAKKTIALRWPEIRAHAAETLKRLRLDINLDEIVGNLSLAQQQLVAICRALSGDVKLLIMDEPTTALTRTEVDNLFSVVLDLQAKGISILFVSHKLNEVLEVAERFTILRDGKWIGTFQRSELDSQKLVRLMTGQEVAADAFRPGVKEREVLLETRNLSKRNNFREITFQLHRGEILGLTGLLGSGRTELALALFGMNRPDSGEIYFEGRPVKIRSAQDSIRLGISYVPENRIRQGLVIGQSIGSNVILATADRLLDRFRLISSLKRTQVIRSWIQRLGIKVSDPDLPVETLSGGNQQKVVIARWLATSPKMLILDSPTVGIDVGAKRSVHQLIRELAGSGVGIILITDETGEALNNCERVLLMRSGRIIDCLNSSEETELSVQNRLEESRM
ncbi:MAG TPA: sugar ABC transporter ATP-binding protein [Chthoniobacterales bacterium]